MYYTAKCKTSWNSVSFRVRLNCVLIAKKEDDPEQALKEFKAIVDKEEEKGDWWVAYRSNVNSD